MLENYKKLLQLYQKNLFIQHGGNRFLAVNLIELLPDTALASLSTTNKTEKDKKILTELVPKHLVFLEQFFCISREANLLRAINNSEELKGHVFAILNNYIPPKQQER